MKLRHLEIRSLPGIDQAIAVRPSGDRVSVITGPNASGKSSLGRALQALLYPELTEGFVDLRAELEMDGERWTVQRRGPDSRWLRDGKPQPPPDLPAPEHLGAFLIHTDQLSAAGHTEARIAAELERLLAGGYDLDAVLAAPPLEAPPRPRKLAEDYHRRSRAVDEFEAECAGLAAELDRLDELRERQQAAIAAGERLALCKRALELTRARADLAAVERAQARFPAAMDQLRGDELERLREADERIAEHHRRIRAQRERLERARQAFADTGIDDPDALERFRSLLGDLQADWKVLEDRRNDLARSTPQLDAALADARARAGGEVDRPGRHLDPARLEELDQAVDKVRALREEKDQVQVRLRRLQAEGASGERIEPLTRACQSLRSWLRQPEPSRPQVFLWITLLAMGVVSGVTSGIAGFQLHMLLPVALAIGVPAFRLFRISQFWLAGSAARNLYPRNQVEEPVGWTPDEVEARLDDLERELAGVRRAFEDHGRYRDLGARLEALEIELPRLEAHLEKVAAGLGLNTELRLSSGFLIWCRAVVDWQQADRRLQENRLAREQADQEIADLAARIRAEFEAADLDAPDDALTGAGALHRYLNRLGADLQQAHVAAQKCVEAERGIADLEASLESLAASRRRIFTDADLAADDEDELRRRLGQLEPWRKLAEQHIRLTATAQSHREMVAADEELLQLAESGDFQPLERLGDELQAVAAERDALGERIARLRQRRAEVLDKRELESLNQAAEVARGELADALDAHCTAAAAGLLIDDVRAAYRGEFRPAVLARAADWFARFTGHRSALEFDGRAFAARDLARNRVQPLDELSTGTRVQLLLAVRLAWIGEAERGREPLPIILDEVLSTSDAVRYREVVEAIQEMVRGGRQVLYLSAQDADAQAWKRFAGKPEPAILRIDSSDPEPGLDFTLPEIPQWPEATLEPAEWARRASVAAFDPWADPAAMDPFHLLRDDLETVVALRRLGIDSLGQASDWLGRRAARRVLDDDARERLDRRIRAARCFIEYWRRGRLQPVTAADLADSGAVSETFMEAVSALAEELDGDPEALIAALRDRQVPRFLNRNIERLEEWLAEAGRLDASEPPAAGETEAAMAAAGDLTVDEAARLTRWLTAGMAPEEDSPS